MQTTPFNLDAVNAKPVVLAPAQTIELWIIGCGGTGSFLVQLLCRVALALTAQGRNATLVLVDPDRVEAKNVTRQCFCEAALGSAQSPDPSAALQCRLWVAYRGHR